MSKIDELLKCPIEKLDLSVRSYFCLKNFHIETIGDLINYDTSDLIRVRNLSLRCYEEIISKAHDMGLFFKNEKEENKEKIIKK